MKFLKIEDFKNDSEIKVVSLNRPEVKNAFNPEMISEITLAFRNFHDEPKLKAIVLTGEGNCFCAGADLNWMKEMIHFDLDQNIQDSRKLWDMFDAMAQCPLPIIGLLQGAVYGGGLGLMACCDYVFADAKTTFCFSEVKLGLAPAVISSFVLRKISDGFARPLMLSAEVFNVDTAVRMGLLHRVLPTFESWADEIKNFSNNGADAMKETKKLLNEIEGGLSWIDQKRLTTKVISERRVSAEAQARLKIFLDKN